jgi:serine/threonine-protein kinase
VVPVRELLIADAELALVTELVPGPNLRERLARSGPFPPAVAAWVALDIARALDSVHGAGLVHGELKPTNLLFAPPDGAVRLTDARIARLTRGYRDGAARFAVPAYAAPEVILGGAVVPPTDVYLLGLLLFEMLTGGPLCPEGLSAHLRVRPIVPFGLPAELRELIEDCLRLDPSYRPVPAAVAAALRRLEPAPGPGIPYPRYEPVPAPPPPPAPAPRVTASPRTAPAAPRPAPGTPARTGSARTRIALLVAAALLVAGLTMVILQSLPSARSGQDDGTGRAPAAPGTVSPLAPPQLTADARAATQAGATAFVRYWFATLTYATATGDTGPFQAASGQDCAACASAIQAIHAGWRGGQQLRGGAYTVRNVSADGFFTVEHPALTTVFDRSPRATVAGAGTELGVLPGITFATCRVLLERNGADWRALSAQSDHPLA